MPKLTSMSKEEKLKQMTETPVEKLIPRLAVPTIKIGRASCMERV